MTKSLLREKAIKLRLEGYTYNQIKQQIRVSKSTLSGWLQNIKLSKKQAELLTTNKNLGRNLRIEKYRTTTQNKRLKKLKDIYIQQKKHLLPLSQKEMFIAGLFLYLGEGSKQRKRLSVSNSNPLVIQFAKYWMENALHIPTGKLFVRLHLYSDMDIEIEIDYWSKILNLPKTQFKKPYIKKSMRENITYKNYGHGTCNIMVFNAEASDQTAMAIKNVLEFCGAKNDLFWYI